MSSPTQRSLAECKKRGWTAAIVEKWNPHARIRQDLFGCIDILAITPAGILGIQACAGASHAARAEKCRQEPRIATWIGAGASLAIWSWSKRGERGKRKLWALREESISVDSSPFWQSVRELAAMRAGIPDERRALSAVRNAFMAHYDDGKCHCTYEVGSGGPTCTCGRSAA